MEWLTFAPDGRSIVRITKSDGRAVLHDWPDLKENQRLDMLGTNLCNVSFSPDGQYLATSDRAGNIRLWRSPISPVSSRRAGTPLHDFGRLRVETIWGGSWTALSPKGALLVARSNEELRLWRIQDRSEIPVPQIAQPAISASISADEKLLATGYTDGRVQCWRISAHGLQLDREFRIGETQVRIAFSPDPAQLAVVSEAGLISLLDLPARAQRVISRAHNSEIVSLAYSTDGHRLVTSCGTGEVKLWDVTTARELVTLTAVRHEVGWSTGFSPDGNTIFARTRTGYFWTVPSLKEIDATKDPPETPGSVNTNEPFGCGIRPPELAVARSDVAVGDASRAEGAASRQPRATPWELDQPNSLEP